MKTDQSINQSVNQYVYLPTPNILQNIL